MFATNEIPMAIEIHALFPGEEQGDVAGPGRGGVWRQSRKAELRLLRLFL